MFPYPCPSCAIYVLLHIHHVSSIMLDNKLLEMGSKFRSGRCRSQCSRRLCSKSALHFFYVCLIHPCTHVGMYMHTQEVQWMSCTSRTRLPRWSGNKRLEVESSFRFCSGCAHSLECCRLPDCCSSQCFIHALPIPYTETCICIPRKCNCGRAPPGHNIYEVGQQATRIGIEVPIWPCQPTLPAVVKYDLGIC